MIVDAYLPLLPKDKVKEFLLCQFGQVLVFITICKLEDNLLALFLYREKIV